ncbi:hypothetical protein TeGR_g14884, partial [Tetraparma gracilis]
MVGTLRRDPPTDGSAESAAAQVEAAAAAHGLQLQPSDPYSVLGSLMQPGVPAASPRIPVPSFFQCPSRKQPQKHANAYIHVDPRPAHGAKLLCSDPACRAQGSKFKWCDVCCRPVASRNFIKRHGHGRMDHKMRRFRKAAEAVGGVG